MTRHNWLNGDTCVKCGLHRHGFSGGRTGGLTYYPPIGPPRNRAGSCVPSWPLQSAPPATASDPKPL